MIVPMIYRLIDPTNLPAINRTVEVLNSGLGENYVNDKYLQTAIRHSELVCIAMYDNDIVGAATARTMPEKEIRETEEMFKLTLPSRNVVLFESSAVLPEFRGQGIGHSLNLFRIGWASMFARLGISISWRTGTEESYPVWKKLGAKEIGTCEAYFKDTVDEDHPCPICGADCKCSGTLMVLELLK